MSGASSRDSRGSGSNLKRQITVWDSSRAQNKNVESTASPVLFLFEAACVRKDCRKGVIVEMEPVPSW